MTPNPFLGVVLHTIGGLAAASFYVPYKRVRGWAWETFWLAGGVFSWIVAPWVIAFLTTPDPLGAITGVPSAKLFWPWFFGILWGVGGLTFGLSMRYLGISLGYAVALGFCAAFGTLIPAIPNGKLMSMFANVGGRVVLLGVAVCLGGIGVSGAAGHIKEREKPEDETTPELNVRKGLVVATFAGIMSACMAFAIQAGEPIGKRAVELGADPIWQNTPVFIVILLGGFLTNAVWCTYLYWRNGTGRQLLDRKTPLLPNYLLCALGGTVWYLQFMFYGMGTTQMGAYNFSSWTLHMSAIVFFSTLWGVALREWRGTSLKAHLVMAAGLATLILSILIVGYGNYLGSQSS